MTTTCDQPNDLSPFRQFLEAQLATMSATHAANNDGYAAAAHDLLLDIAFNCGGYIGAGEGDYDSMIDLMTTTMREGLASMKRFRATLAAAPSQTH